MGYRSRKTACIVAVGALCVLAVICQQWILSGTNTDEPLVTPVANFDSLEYFDSIVYATKPMSHLVHGGGSVDIDFGDSARKQSSSAPTTTNEVHVPRHSGDVIEQDDSSHQVKAEQKPEHVSNKLSNLSLTESDQQGIQTTSEQHNYKELKDSVWNLKNYIKQQSKFDSIKRKYVETLTDSHQTNSSDFRYNKQNKDLNFVHKAAVSESYFGEHVENVVNNMDADEFAQRESVNSDFMKEPPTNMLPTKRSTITVIDSATSPSNKAGLVNVVSMSLYGSELRYTFGAIRNAELVRQNFPGWRLWIYMESSSSSRFAPVPQDVIRRLVALGAEVHYITPEDDFVPPMMWRFLVADDPAVDRFIVRDVDSRLTLRDAAAVAAWIKSGAAFHCIRDHPSHAGYAVSGGMWGGRAPDLRIILRRSWAAMMRGITDGYLDDMNFLNNVVWPRIERDAYCSDSVSCDRWTAAYPFPVSRRGYEHVGQVYDENDIGRHVDMQILRDNGENVNCVPNKKSL